MSQPNTITSVAALTVIRAVEQRRKPVAELFTIIGLDQAAAPDAERHVPAERYFALWERALQLVQDSNFAAQVGAAFDLEALEAFGFLALSCETLGDAYERTARVRALYNAGARWELDIRGDRLRMQFWPWPVTVRSELARRAVSEYQIAEMLASLRQMTQHRLVPRRIAFRHAPPASPSAFKALFDAAPAFDETFDGFEADASWLDLPLRSTNPKLRDYFVKQCQRACDAFASDPPFTGQVRRHLAASMDGQLPDMSSIARALGTSPRSLHRRLGEEGARWNDLVDQTRRQFAEVYLSRPRLSVAEVAYLLGFSDASAFFKAFKRWTGTTPSQHRAQQRDH